MKSFKYKLLASSNSLDGILNLICEYYNSKSIQILESGMIGNSKGIIHNVRCIYKNGRYRFERNE